MTVPMPSMALNPAVFIFERSEDMDRRYVVGCTYLPKGQDGPKFKAEEWLYPFNLMLAEFEMRRRKAIYSVWKQVQAQVAEYRAVTLPYPND